MKIAIVTPVYNEAGALRSQLEHLRELTAEDPATHALLVDGGSTDGTREILRSTDLPCIEAERGRAAQMNAGAAATTGDVLLFLHADTRLPAGGLAGVREAIRNGAVGGFFGVELESGRPLLRLVGSAISLRSRLTGIATGDQALFVKRATFEQLGGYAPLPLFEDVELSRRLRRMGRVARVPHAVRTSARRWERLGPVRTIVRMWVLRALYSLGVEPRRLADYYETAR